jgi:cytochrome c-type biogenesis protein CcmH
MSAARRGLAARGALGVAAGLLLLLMLPLLVWPARADDLDEGVRRIAKQLRCPICESVSVADSPADLAIQMRGLIRRKLEAGESDQQILDYFVAAYGDSVLLEPPRRGLGWLIWLGPVVAFGVGAAILALVLRNWVRRRATDVSTAVVAGEALGRSVTDSSLLATRAHEELEALRKAGLR